MNNENPIKFVISLLLAAVAGAAVALLFAPTSGRELRTDIKTQSETEYTKLQNEVQKSIQDMHSRMDKMSSELQALSSSRAK